MEFNAQLLSRHIATTAPPRPRPERLLRPGGNGMGITELALGLETTTRALRYYEEMKLIRHHRNERGVRSYGPQARRELELMVTLRRVGSSLDQIKAVMSVGS